MNKYIGKICPYCKSVLTEEDDIVVCSDCEMPHHKECWVDNRGCTTFGCSGSIQGVDIEMETNPGSSQRYEAQNAMPGAGVPPKFCGRCGAQVMKGCSFCVKCGSPVLKILSSYQTNVNSQRGNPMGSHAFSGPGNGMSGFQMNVSADSEWGAYIGNEQGYYLREFAQLDRTNGYISWNWPAFLIAPFWCLYRKMYVPGGILLAVNLFLTLVGGVFLGLLGFAIAITAGLFANYFYKYDLEQRIRRGRNLQGIQKSQHIETFGGVNVTAALVSAFVYILLCIIVLIR